MGRPLVGKQAIAGFFGTGWKRVTVYIALGAPIVKGPGSNSTYEADQTLLENWWHDYIFVKLPSPDKKAFPSLSSSKAPRRGVVYAD